MAQEFDTPPDFPIDGDPVEEGDKKKFIVEAECTGKDDDGTMHWEIESIDGVKIPEDKDDQDEKDQGGVADDYDTSGDEEDEDVSSEGKAKTTKGVGLLILGKK